MILIKKVGIRNIMFIGISVGVLSLFIYIWSIQVESLIMIHLSLLLYGVSYAIIAPSSLCFSLSNMPKKGVGMAVGIFYMVSMFSGSTGLVVVNMLSGNLKHESTLSLSSYSSTFYGAATLSIIALFSMFLVLLIPYLYRKY